MWGTGGGEGGEGGYVFFVEGNGAGGEEGGVGGELGHGQEIGRVVDFGSSSSSSSSSSSRNIRPPCAARNYTLKGFKLIPDAHVIIYNFVLVCTGMCACQIYGN